jgi:hypothetical protein
MKKLSFHVSTQNGYHGINEYLGTTGTSKDQCQLMILSFKTKKQAESVTRQLNLLANQINELKKV